MSHSPVMRDRHAGPPPRVALTLATWFGAGLAPKAPGTFGTLAALPLAWWVGHHSFQTQLVVLGVLLAVAVPAAQSAGRWFGVVDAKQIVIDEVAGLLVTMLGVPVSWGTMLAGFALFRLFDIAKPWPVSFFDRKVKNGFGVVFDDVMAGFYARACLALAAIWWPHLFAGA
jgi:phosphatidylglycerophosphatase A